MVVVFKRPDAAVFKKAADPFLFDQDIQLATHGVTRVRRGFFCSGEILIGPMLGGVET